MKPLLERMRVIEPWLIDGRIHMPFWELHAAASIRTRLAPAAARSS